MRLTIDEKVQSIPFYPKAMMYGFEDGWTILSSNENPYPLSEKVFSAILDALPSITRYPGGEAELKTAIAGSYGLASEEVVIGNGSNELIELTFRAMKNEQRKETIVSDPSFAFYRIAAQIYGYEVKSAPIADMRVDLDALLALVNERTRLIFLNNPLNPTGTIFEEKEFADFLRKLPDEVLVVVDEAYAEFATNEHFPRSIQYVNDFPVLVLRTFSKAYGLAGLRIGYGLGEKSLMSFLERTKQPFSINIIALMAARAALSDQAQLKKVLENNARGKEYFYGAFGELGLKCIPTEANFIIVRIGSQAEAVTKRLFERQVIVRWMGAYGLPDYIRVTIGTMEECKYLIDSIGKVLRSV